MDYEATGNREQGTGGGGQIARATVIDVPVHQQRSLATVTAEIRTLQDAARRVVLSYSVEIGRRLVEAKSMVGHGEWGSYLREELGFSQSTANNHMRLFEAYGADQMTLDGAAVKSQALANLSYTQALELLALPSEEEREAFVEGHDMDKISTRELREELKKRGGLTNTEDPESFAAIEAASLWEDFMDEARVLHGAAPADTPPGPDAELLKARLKEAEEEIKAGQTERDRLADQARTAASKQSAAEAQAQAAAEKMATMEKQLREARATENAAIKAEKAAVKALKEAKENPNIPQETLEKLRQEAEEAARKALEAESGGKSLREAQAQYVQAEREASEARQEAARARQEAERLEKELRMAEPKVAVFRDRFTSLQADLSALIVSIDELPADKQAGARKGIRAILQNALNMVQEPEEEGENHE